jgi:hypothetical protein
MVSNLSACAAYTTKLQQELLAEVPSIFQDEPPTQQLVVRHHPPQHTPRGLPTARLD